MDDTDTLRHREIPFEPPGGDIHQRNVLAAILLPDLPLEVQPPQRTLTGAGVGTDQRVRHDVGYVQGMESGEVFHELRCKLGP